MKMPFSVNKLSGKPTSLRGFPRSRLSWRIPTRIGAVLTLFIFTCFSGLSWAKDLDIAAIGIRGGMNFQDAGLPPGEKEDFEQFEVFGIVSLPGGWEYESGWAARWRVNGSAGVLRGAGDIGLMTTITPGLAFTNINWNLTFDAGAGGALISDWKYGRQDIGGPFQFIAHGGVSVHLPGNLVTGYRFHHMSDATIYGASRGVDFHMIEFSYHFGNK